MTAYKVALLLTAAESAKDGSFRDRWLPGPRPEFPVGLRSWFHNTAGQGAVPIENAPPAPFDGIDEFLFDQRQDAVAWFGSPEFERDWLAPRRQWLGAAISAISGLVHDVWLGGMATAADTVKIFTLPVRRPGMSMDAFARHWLEVNAGLALAGPGTRERLARLVSTPADRSGVPGFAPAPFDGCGVIQFVDTASFEAEFASDHYREVMAPDEPRFTDPANSRVMMVSETCVYART